MRDGNSRNIARSLVDTESFVRITTPVDPSCCGGEVVQTGFRKFEDSIKSHLLDLINHFIG
jgi:F0F1-type ATP synthase delta subunit